MESTLAEEIELLYAEPGIGATYTNTYGELNLQNLVAKYQTLAPHEMKEMLAIVESYSLSFDLTASFISVSVLHALGETESVDRAYQWAQKQADPGMFIQHFDIGKSLAEYFISS